MSKIQVDTIDTRSGTSTMQIGSTNTSTINIGVSGDTVNIPSGVTIANAGTATGFGTAGTGAFRVRKDSLTIANSTDVLITGLTEEFDADNLFANDKYTVAVTGTYFFHYSIRNNNSGTATRFKIVLKQNGSELSRTNGEISTGSSNYSNAQMSVMVGANANDYFEIATFQNSGDSNFAAFDIIFQGFRIS